jgi:hypothetical protein
VGIGTGLPPRNRTCALLALLMELDTDHAVIMAAAAMIAIVIILRMSSTSGIESDVRQFRWRQTM